MRRVVSSPNHHASDSAAAYDAYASRYDSLLSENRINAYMRQVMMNLQALTFERGQRLLEIGCGTGDEALALAAHGCDILAIDPSAEMIRLAEEKASRQSVGGKVSFQVAYARDLARVLSGERDGSFDGAYSSFALSYEPELGPVREALVRSVRPGGAVLLSVMNRLSFVEWAFALASLHPALAGRRLQPATRHKVGTAQTLVYPRTLSELRRAFAPGFTLERVRALPAVLPPHYANRFLLHWPSVLNGLSRIDSRVGGWPILNRLGDHNVVTMRRTPQGDLR